jgi:DNA-binding XRE family transcriptional regulator
MASNKETNREKLGGGTFQDLKNELRADPEYRLAHKLHSMSAMIGREIASKRKEAGLTQAKLADKLGVDQSLIALLESKNPARVPTLLTIARVADACGADVEVVFHSKVNEDGATSGDIAMQRKARPLYR